MLDLVHLTGFEKRRPAQLSGGQQQRVALARALATSPAVMLLDEPLSALDAKLRLELRVELKEIIRSVGATTIVVTHDQEEAMSLGARIIVMNHGRILQQGGPVEIYNRPANRFVAEFVGRSNWFEGQLRETLGEGIRRFVTDDNLSLAVAVSSTGVDGDFGICIRPERIRIEPNTESNRDPGLKFSNRIPGRIIDSAHLGPDLHRFVLLASGRRVSVVEKYLGQFVGQLDETISLVFEPQDCLQVPRN
jgi:ABC-type Fe3+/spermidine/putrescine transport system ATPase subunit